MTKKQPAHPSHGLALFCTSTSNGRRLFGSPLDTHYTCVRLSISAALIMGEDGDGESERYINGEEYIEIEFSAQQFGELVSRQNIMPGIPCTIIRRNGSGIEPPPKRPSNQNKISADFKTKVRGLLDGLKTKRSKLEQILSKASIGKGDREQIRRIFEHFEHHIEHNLPFAIEMFAEATHDTVAAARQEIAVALRTALQIAGAESFGNKELIEPPEKPQLKEHNE